MRAKTLLIAAWLLLYPLLAIGQNYKVSVTLQDASTGEPVGFATVSGPSRIITAAAAVSGAAAVEWDASKAP